MGSSSESTLETEKNKQRSFEQFQMINEKVIDTANLALRSAILINGGAAVAILGFVASFSGGSIDDHLLMIGVSHALLFFSWRVFRIPCHGVSLNVQHVV